MLYLQLNPDPFIYYLFFKGRKIDFGKLIFHKHDIIATLFHFLPVFIDILQATLVCRHDRSHLCT